MSRRALARRAARTLYVEDAIGFGGSLVSLVELLTNLPAARDWRLLTHRTLRSIAEERGIAPDRIVIAPPQWTQRIRAPQSLRLAEYAVTVAVRTLRFAVRILRSKPDVVHLNNGLSSNIPALLAAKLLGCTVVCHQRNLESPTRLTRALARYVNPDAHIAITSSVAQSLYDLGISRDLVHVIFDPIMPPQATTNADRGTDTPSRVEVAAFSMLLPWKGHELLLRAFAQAITQTTAPLHLRIYGDSPTEDRTYITSLRSLCDALSISHQVAFMGRAPNVWEALTTVDIAVHTSLQPEPFGRVIAEAMMAGVAVIASEGGGASELIDDGTDGFTFPSGDSHALAERISRLADDPPLRLALSTRARASVRTRFTPEVHVRQVLEVYERHALR